MILNKYIYLTFAFLLFISNSAFASCGCVPASLETRWKKADIIFTGTVHKIEVVNKYYKSTIPELPVKVTISILERFKGVKKEKEIDIHTSLSKFSCTGYPLEENKDYLFYGYKREPGSHEEWSFYNFPSGTYGIGGLCGGTAPIEDEDTKEELKALRKETS